MAPFTTAEVLGCLAHLRLSHVGAPPAALEPRAVRIYMDATGAHLDPRCQHSYLWRTTRPMDALQRRYYREGEWPEDLEPYKRAA